MPAAAGWPVTVKPATPPFAARPAGTVQVRRLPTGAVQVAPPVTATFTFSRLAGKVSVRVTGAVLAPSPLLVAVTLQLRVAPILMLAWSTVFFTATFGLVMVLVVWQALGALQAGLSGPPGMTRFARLPPPCVACAVMVTVRLPFRAASWPAATEQVCVLDATHAASGGHVTPGAATTLVTTRFGGSRSARVTAPWLAILPVLLAVIVQMMSSPTLAVALFAVLVTRTFGPGTVTMARFGWSFATSVDVVAMTLVTAEIFDPGCV